MNIFAFDPDPEQSALWLDDVRKNKMILETAQLLSTAIRLNDPTTTLKVYKVTHKGHPCTQWTRKSRENFEWLMCYMYHCDELNKHKSFELYDLFWSYLTEGWFPEEDLSIHPNCARNMSQGLDFTNVVDPHAAYKMYINERWKRDTIKLSWTKGEKPDWATV